MSGNGWCGQLGRDDGAERYVVLLSEAVMHDIAVASDQNAGRRSLHPVSPHGDGYRHALDGVIDANREGQTIFVDECLQRYRRHRGVMLENGVQSDDLKVGVLERSKARCVCGVPWATQPGQSI